MTWLRWDTTAPMSDLVGYLADELKVELAHAFGAYVACCLGFGEHRQDGRADQVTDATLEHWALWRGKRGAFARAFRARCVDEAGRVRGWVRQERLLQRLEADRLRKEAERGAGVRRKSAGNPQDKPRNSGRSPEDKVRNVTIRSSTNVELYRGVFDEAWKRYPRRPGHSPAKAWRAWCARIREGEDPQVLLAGVTAYAAFVAREQTPERFVKHAATFFGPDRPYRDDYGPPPDELIAVYDERGEITPEAARVLGAVA